MNINQNQHPTYSSMDERTQGTNLIIVNPSVVNQDHDDDYSTQSGIIEHLPNTRNVPGNKKTEEESTSTSTRTWSSIYNFIQRLKIFRFLYKICVLIFLPIWIWLAIYVLVGQDALPGGSVFVLVVIACGGRIVGSLLEIVNLPPMIGMLGLGLTLRNVSYVDFGKHLNLIWSAPIRQTALAVILTRAGLGLDPNILAKFKHVILRFAFFPTVLEAICVTVLAYFVLEMPWIWGFLLGCVLAPVSPAVVVPRLLELKNQRYGMEKGIPTIIIASASLDNVIAISLFGVVLNFAIAEGSLAFSVAQGPLQVVIGVTFGLCWGFFLGVIFRSEQKDDPTEFALRFMFTFGGGLISIIGLGKLGFSGAGALGCLLAAFTAASVWRIRETVTTPDPMSTAFLFLWKIFEPLLFGVIGCQIDISSLEVKTILLGLVCICAGLLIRVFTVFLMVSKANLNIREKLFSSLAWIPKATVQAAIGPIALDMVKQYHKGQEAEKYATNILNLAVLTILVTAPIGELAVMFSGKRLLTKHEDHRLN